MGHNNRLAFGIMFCYWKYSSGICCYNETIGGVHEWFEELNGLALGFEWFIPVIG